MVPNFLSVTQRIFLAIGSLLIGWIMSVTLESTIRLKGNKTPLVSNKAFYFGFAVTGLMILALPISGIHESFHGSLAVQQNSIFSKQAYEQHSVVTWQQLKVRKKRFQSADTTNILVVGDSLAGDVINMVLDARADKDNLDIQSFVIPKKCQISVPREKEFYEAVETKPCERIHRDFLIRMTEPPLPDKILLAGDWSELAAQRLPYLVEAILTEVPAKIFVFGSKTLSGYHLNWNEVILTGLSEDRPKATPSESSLKVNKVLRELSQYNQFEYIDLLKAICPRDLCPLLTNEGSPFYYDTFHITLEAIKEVRPKIQKTKWMKEILKEEKDFASSTEDDEASSN